MFLKTNLQGNEKLPDEQQIIDLTQLPESMLLNNRLPVRFDVYQCKSNDKPLKFIEIINKLNRVDDRRALSKSTITSMQSIQNQS
jgi:hypothetical protein